MKNSLRQKTYWKEIEAEIKKSYKSNCIIEDPVPIKARLPSGKQITIERKWYDLLVKEAAYADLLVTSHGKTLDASAPGIHCIEVKFSKGEDPHKFGAFTLGEWIAAYISNKMKKFSYEIYFVRQLSEDSPKVHISKVQVSDKVLKEMLFYPQVKLYFYSWFLKENLPSDLRSTLPSKRERRPQGKLLDEVHDVLKKHLNGLVEEDVSS